MSAVCGLNADMTEREGGFTVLSVLLASDFVIACLCFDILATWATTKKIRFCMIRHLQHMPQKRYGTLELKVALVALGFTFTISFVFYLLVE